MSILYETRGSDSPFVEMVTHGRTEGAGSTIRPAECCWHMVRVKINERARFLVVGPLTTAGVVSWTDGAEILWIKFKLGTFMPHLPTRNFMDGETLLPEATRQSFWLNGSAWEMPNVENVETFLDRLARENILARDPIVKDVLQGHQHELAARSVRHHFLRATGMAQNQIRQYERAQKAAALLQQGKSILDTVDELNYFDQPHLTRALKQFVGHTPAQIARLPTFE